jgi:hypothetical protein
MQKVFRHPVERFLGIHNAVENPISMPRHVECQDCHNPHTAVAGEASAPDIALPNSGVSGIDTSGGLVDTAHYEYELCFRCHADGPDVPPPYVERQILQPNIRLKVDPGNPSYHPIEDVGRSVDMPSLLFPLTEISIIYCSDCHSGNPGELGSGARGPHGSIWPFLLEEQYSIEDGTSESFQAYAMCYKCHDREVILSDVSSRTHK